MDKSCTLCFESEDDEQLIDIASDEAQRLNIVFVLHQHFPFCFESETRDGFVCQKCWVKVSVFHEFYCCIERMHGTGHTIFIECEPIPGAVRLDPDGADEMPDDCKLNEEKNESSKKVVEKDFGVNMSEFNDDGINGSSSEDAGDDDDFFRDAIDQQMPHRAPATTAKIEKNSTPKRKRIKKTDGYKRKYDRRIRHDYSTYQCDICKTYFLSFTNLYRHIMKTHNVKQFKCENRACCESFETQQLLDEHFESDHKHTQCPHCKTKVLRRYLAEHIQNQHEKASHVICETCGKVSLNKHMHLVHVKMNHDTRGKFQCDICSQWYKNLFTIRAHLKRHSGKQTCTICGKVLAHKEGLESHKQLHNPEFRERFKCTVCGKGFRFSKRLQEHMHIHAGTAGSYHCNECGKIFRFSSAYYVHRKKMHPK